MQASEIDPLLDALRAIRERERLTLEELARRVECSPGHLSMLFAGKRRPGLRVIRRIVRRYPEIRPLLATSLGWDDDAVPRPTHSARP